MAFWWKTTGVQLFFWEKTVGNGDYKVMSKINPLINDVFYQNNTVWHPIIQKNHWLSIMKVLQLGEAIEISAQYFNKTMNSMKSTLDHF
jgi:hypothetical protein